ncbi:aconitate hydratase AcnA [Saccharophagus degradans]|uniref:Aconitate hydratase n=1 Tax=Saccharophagus degradans (strain 2-40 / ATCC 43961 / DSM 17024) TaxID=203122 RepID=Q21J78_SACD2|nr:aconitate hydratase AcnA [Saccharophagus degradans]ABD81251.1 aconitase [Saccharophagus degradans 2-40]
MDSSIKCSVKNQLSVGAKSYDYFDLSKVLERLKRDNQSSKNNGSESNQSTTTFGSISLADLPFCLKIMLENAVRNLDTKNITEHQVQALLEWPLEQQKKGAKNDCKVAFSPSRVLLQDFTGVPAIVDLAAMREAIVKLGGKPQDINPLTPVDLVIDHSVMVDYFGTDSAFKKNTDIEFKRNKERYQFLKWGQKAFANFRVVPPGTGIVHQVNLEFLASVVTTTEKNGRCLAYPDTLVGTDSHTTMINGLGVLGWGVGGIEAEAAMLGQPISMSIPDVIGFELSGQLKEGATATDLVLTITQQLRAKGVVGKFVEFYGDGLTNLPLADRATIANMAPEYGATCGIFPIDEHTLRYLELTGRPTEHIALVKEYAKAQGLWREDGCKPAVYTETLKLDLALVAPCIAGPKRPQDRIAIRDAKSSFFNEPDFNNKNLADTSLEHFASEGGSPETNNPKRKVKPDYSTRELQNGDIVIAAITSCTNTSNPAVMVAAGLIAQKAIQLGLTTKPWVKTSFAPGSQVVPAYLKKAGLDVALDALGFNLVGFGCTTCIGNSGPLPNEIVTAIERQSLTVCSVLSGNRNFEGRIHQQVKANYLASPPLVVAYALAGSITVNLATEPLGYSTADEPIYLNHIWPSQNEVAEVMAKTITAQQYRHYYADVFSGTEQWQALAAPDDATYNWPSSNYIANPPYFKEMEKRKSEIKPIENARCLALLGDSITTDHISPAGAISAQSPAGKYLQELGVKEEDFNSLGSRRGNHEVMIRGTFANPRLRNLLCPEKEGGYTLKLPSEEIKTIYDAAQRYKKHDTPLVVIAGKEYGSGSSRDWAAKGVKLLGVRAVIAESYERIHRANLVGFGVLPLQFLEGQSAEKLEITGKEQFTIENFAVGDTHANMKIISPVGDTRNVKLAIRIDTPVEWEYYQHGGILHYVLRQMTGDTQA